MSPRTEEQFKEIREQKKTENFGCSSRNIR